MKIWDYILAPLEGPDGKLSLRALLAIASLSGMIKYVETHPAPDSNVMFVFVVLIFALLGLSTTQNILDKYITAKTPSTTP